MTTTHRAECHCGAVSVAITGEIDFVLECNCSMCSMKGMLHWIVSRDRFEIVRGEDALSLYQFGTRRAKHYFCKTCGIAPFYVPRSHPDKVDINLRCVANIDIGELSPQPFDGQNWEHSIHELRSKKAPV